MGWFEVALTWIGEQFNKTFIVKNRWMLFLEGFGNTLVITLGAMLIGVFIGVLVAVIRVYNNQTGRLKVPNAICGVYLAIFRGTPIVVQLLIMNFIVLSNIQSGVLIAVICFGINSGSYVAEIVRAGISAVDIGQTEAGRSLGLPPVKAMFLIVLPQAIKNILPALGNEFVTLLKETSVAGYVGVIDFAQAGASIRANTGEAYFSLIFVAVIYFLMVFGITKLLKLAEGRLAKGDRGQKAK